MASKLTDQERALIDAYWRAANYLSVGQIYLYRQSAAEEAARQASISSRACSGIGERRQD